MTNLSDPKKPNAVLIGLGAALALIYGAVTGLSHPFHSPLNPELRPLLTVLILFGAATLAYLLACCIVWKKPNERPVTGRANIWAIVGFGILFRLIVVFSTPIQEIDLYRYIVDGVVGNAGVSPYEFAPEEIVRAAAELEPLADAKDLPRLEIVFARDSTEQQQLDLVATHIASRPGLHQCAATVHYGQFTTPYPPVSQAVFRIATAFVPDGASSYVWMLAMKITLVAFDIATGFLLMALLAGALLPRSYSLLYWWSPLVIKEVSNSGHLDSIAICLTVAFAWAAIVGLGFGRAKSPSVQESSKPFNSKMSVLAALLLGLSVGAKIYPLVLAPAWTFAMLRRGGWRAIPISIAFVFVAAAVNWSMVARTEWGQQLNQPDPTNVTAGIAAAHLSDQDTQLVRGVIEERRGLGLPDVNVQRRPQTGIEVFSKFWEMNDLVFMFIVENVRHNQPTDGTQPWFLVTSEAWRTDVSRHYAQQHDLPIGQAAFGIARRATLITYCVLTICLCVMAWRSATARGLLAIMFFAIAWFWILSPTQNPWYWCWAIPFLPFLKRPAPWLVLGGMLFLYYLRFYFEQHYAQTPVAGTPYAGVLFFDFVIPWIEFTPVYLWAIGAWVMRFGITRGTATGTES